MLFLLCGCGHEKDIDIAKRCINDWEVNRSSHYDCTYSSVDSSIYKAKITCVLNATKRELNHTYNFAKYMVAIGKDGKYVLSGVYWLYGKENVMIMNSNCLDQNPSTSKSSSNNSNSTINNNGNNSNYNSNSDNNSNSNFNNNYTNSSSNNSGNSSNNTTKPNQNNSNSVTENKDTSETNNKEESNSSASVAPTTPTVQLNIDVVEWGLGSINVNVSTNLQGYKCNIYLNSNIVKEQMTLGPNTHGYGNSETFDEIPVGNNTIRVDLLKDGNIVQTKTVNYNFDLSKVPTPTFNIGDSYNTYDSTFDVTVWENKNGCDIGSRCKLELYVDGVKQRSTSEFTVPLSIGDNIFRVELKNLYGKSSCKRVLIKRFEYNSEVNFTQLGKIQELEC